MSTLTMFDCGCIATDSDPHATDNEGKRYCYPCSANHDRARMITTGKAFLYTSKNDNGKWTVGNSTGLLSFPIFSSIHTGRHNMAGTQTHFWFVGPDRHIWHAIQWGSHWADRSQGLSDGYYCRAYRTKEIWSR